MSLFSKERKCDICGKVFIGSDQWVYKRGETWFCSWKCLREHEKKVNRSRATRMRRLSQGEKGEISRLLMLGKNPQKVATEVGVTLQVVLYYKQKAEA